MTKKLFSIVTAILFAVVPMKAQVFIMDEDEWNGNRQMGDASLIVNNPGVYNSGEDVFMNLNTIG